MLTAKVASAGSLVLLWLVVLCLAARRRRYEDYQRGAPPTTPLKAHTGCACLFPSFKWLRRVCNLSLLTLAIIMTAADLIALCNADCACTGCGSAAQRAGAAAQAGRGRAAARQRAAGGRGHQPLQRRAVRRQAGPRQCGGRAACAAAAAPAAAAAGARRVRPARAGAQGTVSVVALAEGISTP